MIYTFGDDIHATRDDMPLLLQWITKKRTFDLAKVLFFVWSGKRGIPLKGEMPKGQKGRGRASA